MTKNEFIDVVRFFSSDALCQDGLANASDSSASMLAEYDPVLAELTSAIARAIDARRQYCKGRLG